MPRNLSFDELAQYFHLPIYDAAKELKICATSLKKICRRNGVSRWPYRKIKSLDNIIEDIEANMESKTGAKKAEANKELQFLIAKREEIIKHPEIFVKKNPNNLRTTVVKMKPLTQEIIQNTNFGLNQIMVAISEDDCDDGEDFGQEKQQQSPAKTKRGRPRKNSVPNSISSPTFVEDLPSYNSQFQNSTALFQDFNSSLPPQTNPLNFALLGAYLNASSLLAINIQNNNTFPLNFHNNNSIPNDFSFQMNGLPDPTVFFNPQQSEIFVPNNNNSNSSLSNFNPAILPLIISKIVNPSPNSFSNQSVSSSLYNNNNGINNLLFSPNPVSVQNNSLLNDNIQAYSGSSLSGVNSLLTPWLFQKRETNYMQINSNNNSNISSLPPNFSNQISSFELDSINDKNNDNNITISLSLSFSSLKEEENVKENFVVGAKREKNEEEEEKKDEEEKKINTPKRKKFDPIRDL